MAYSHIEVLTLLKMILQPNLIKVSPVLDDIRIKLSQTEGSNQLIMKRCLNKYLDTSQTIAGDLSNKSEIVIILKYHHPMMRHYVMS